MVASHQQIKFILLDKAPTATDYQTPSQTCPEGEQI